MINLFSNGGKLPIQFQTPRIKVLKKIQSDSSIKVLLDHHLLKITVF